MKNDSKIIPLVKDGKNLSLKKRNERSRKEARLHALIHVANATDSPSYIICVDEKTGVVNLESALTDRLSFELKKKIASDVSKAIIAI